MTYEELKKAYEEMYPPTNPPTHQKWSRTKNIRFQTTTGYYEQL